MTLTLRIEMLQHVERKKVKSSPVSSQNLSKKDHLSARSGLGLLSVPLYDAHQQLPVKTILKNQKSTEVVGDLSGELHLPKEVKEALVPLSMVTAAPEVVEIGISAPIQEESALRFTDDAVIEVNRDKEVRHSTVLVGMIPGAGRSRVLVVVRYRAAVVVIPNEVESEEGQVILLIFLS